MLTGTIVMTLLMAVAFFHTARYNSNKYIAEKEMITAAISLIDSVEEIDVNDFTHTDRLHHFRQDVGFYILLNKTKRKFFYGTGDNIAYRIHRQLCVGGNENVYVDFASGNEFTVIVLFFEDSASVSLHTLEDAAFRKFRDAGLYCYNGISFGMS